MVFQLSGSNPDLLWQCNPLTEEGREWIDEYTVYAEKSFMGTATALAFTSAAVALLAGNFFHAIRYLFLGLMGCYGFYLVDQQSLTKNLRAQIEDLTGINEGLIATRQELQNIESGLRGDLDHLDNTKQNLEGLYHNLQREFESFKDANAHLVQVAARVNELRTEAQRLEAANSELGTIRDNLREDVNNSREETRKQMEANQKYLEANQRHNEILQRFQNLFSAFMGLTKNTNPEMHQTLTELERQLGQLTPQMVSS